MTFSARRSASARHLLLHAEGGEAFPDALLATLAAERVKHGWLRVTGVLDDAELRPLGVRDAGGEPTHGRDLATEGGRITATVTLLSMDIAIGGADAPLAFRGLVAIDGLHGTEMMVAEIHRARVRRVDILVTALDDVAAAGTWTAAIEAAARPEPAAAAGALPFAARPPPGAASPAGMAPPAPLPPRPLRPAVDFDAPVPEAGDTVDHFALGRGEVLKSDGDRLHVRMEKDGRIREIALERLVVAPFEGALERPPGSRQFKLQRRI
jgi:hypothetical protein